MNGSLGASVSSPSSAIIDRGDTSRAASAPPIKILLCVLIGSCPFPDLLWLAKAWLVVSSSAGETNCSNASLNGSYALQATGTIGGVGPFAAVGRFNFDGNGNLTGKLWQR